MRVPDEVRDCCAFICCKTLKGMQLAGTGFFVGEPMFPNNADSPNFNYFITAKHVIEAIKRVYVDGNTWIRLNTVDGSTKMLVAEFGLWSFHPSDTSVDAVVLPIDLPPEIKYKMIPISMCLTEEKIKASDIGVGDEVIVIGLFRSHYGAKRNLPLIRIGNIAMMPEEPIKTEYGDAEAYLIEVRSIGGLSGSPVFVNLGLTRRFENQVKFATGNVFLWLGLMHGHWDVQKDQIDNSVDESYNQQLNVGIGIVVPVGKIMEIINQAAWMKLKETTREEFTKKNLPNPAS